LRDLAPRRLTRDPAEIIRELDHLSKVERRLIARQFCRSLVTMSHIAVYWDPVATHFHARVAVGTRRHPLPDNVHYVGTYSHPFNVNDFLGDLNDLEARLEAERRNAAAAVRAG
jgi:hypothetical protein